jgi:hypothetical protein
LRATASPEEPDLSVTLLVDGHVHFHPCFGVAEFLEAAASNFQAARREVGDSAAVGCLLFTENSWRHAFRAFRDGLVERSAEGWSIQPTAEACSLIARGPTGGRLMLFAGRQIVTAERLEVLALCTIEQYPDGLPMAEAVSRALSTGAVTVLPWGFGKWTGGRGRVVEHMLTSPLADELYLGDNGGRPAAGPEPRLFRLARARGVPVLPGSDPLPLAPEVRKPGRVGFVLKGRVPAETPAAAIAALLAARTQPPRFGRLESLPTFVHRQVALRLRRKKTPTPTAWMATEERGA